MAIAERLTKASHKGGKSADLVVHQLSINDPKGKIRCRFYEPVIDSHGQHVHHQGELVYRLSLSPKDGLNFQLSTSECISVVNMKYHPTEQFYTLDQLDHEGVQSWLAQQGDLEASTAPPMQHGRDKVRQQAQASSRQTGPAPSQSPAAATDPDQSLLQHQPSGTNSQSPAQPTQHTDTLLQTPSDQPHPTELAEQQPSDLAQSSRPRRSRQGPRVAGKNRMSEAEKRAQKSERMKAFKTQVLSSIAGSARTATRRHEHS